MSNAFLVGGLGLVVLVFLWDQAAVLPEYGCSGARQQNLCQQLAMKWGPVFGAPVPVLMVIGRIESGWRPSCFNLTPRALVRGGAWGLMQQTLNTAKGHAVNLKSDGHPTIQATLRKFDGSGKSLLDPDLNMMFAAYQIGKLAREFGEDLSLIAAGYHQGAGKVRQMIRDRMTIPEQLPPKGKAYVGAALKYERELYA